MTISAVNHWAILLAVLASFAFGAVWYSVLSKPWLAALGTTKSEIESRARPLPLLLATSIAGLLVMAWVLAGVMAHMVPGGLTMRAGLITAGLIWLGFVATTLITNHGYQGHRWSLTVIDGLHWLGVLLIQGAIIGALAR